VSDNTYGVYVSIRLPSGELFSVSRETVADLKQDLDVFLGDGASSRIQSKLASAVNTEAQAPRATVSAGSGGSDLLGPLDWPVLHSLLTPQM